MSELTADNEVLGINLQNLFECSDGDKEGVAVPPPTSSNSSLSPQPFDGEPPVECHYITSRDDNPNSSQEKREENSHSQNSFTMEQRKYTELREILDYLECGALTAKLGRLSYKGHSLLSLMRSSTSFTLNRRTREEWLYQSTTSTDIEVNPLQPLFWPLLGPATLQHTDYSMVVGGDV